MIKLDNYKYNKSGFTLMEILAVLAIIVILASLLFPALRTARQQANIQKARAMVASLEVAVNMYYTDNSVYPTTGTLSLLVPASGTVYMDNRDYTAPNFIDPWGNAYQYTQPGANNRPFDISSFGPDKNIGGDDDIGNW